MRSAWAPDIDPTLSEIDSQSQPLAGVAEVVPRLRSVARASRSPSRSAAAAGVSAPDDIHDVVAERLAVSELRYTAARKRLVELLGGADRPLTLPEILERDPSLAQSSCYRNLTQLIGAGVVHRITSGEDHSRYELDEDLTDHHHHLVCTSCGQVTDVAADPNLEASLERALRRAARRTGFRLEGHRLDAVGVCADCS